LVLQERLERLGGVSAWTGLYFCSATAGFWCGTSVRSCSQARCSGSEMCMYSVPMVQAVGVAQHAEHVAQLHPGPAGEAAGGELPVEVPQGQPV